jgi:nucleoside-diphosphate-sugar epimerase
MALSVAVTGACGRIGRALTRHLSDRRYPLTLIDRPGSGVVALAPRGTTLELDLSNAPPDDVFANVEVVVHLAAHANPDADWESLLANNVEASYRVAAAAMRAHCRRVIFASSVHAVWAGTHRPVKPGDAVAPADLYGVSKCFVEALAFWCAYSSPTSAAAVRIGAFQSPDAVRERGSERLADVFIADSDLMNLLERAITADYRFAILHAAVPGPDALLDTSMTEDLLGWKPRFLFEPG